MSDKKEESFGIFTGVKDLPVKLLSGDSFLPTKNNESDAAFDLYYSGDYIEIPAGTRVSLPTGIAMEIPEGYAGLIWPRSGMSVKQGVDVLAGVVDCGYRGEIVVCLLNTSSSHITIRRGDKVAQMVIQEVPRFVVKQVDELSQSDRGDKGFGSSGR